MRSPTHQTTCALARAQGTSELRDLASPCSSIYQGQWQFGPISTPVRPTYTLPAPRDRSSHGSSQLASEALCSCIALRSRVAVASQHAHSGFSCCCCPLLSVPRPIWCTRNCWGSFTPSHRCRSTCGRWCCTTLAGRLGLLAGETGRGACACMGMCIRGV